jgi:hypothetical protein
LRFRRFSIKWSTASASKTFKGAKRDYDFEIPTILTNLPQMPDLCSSDHETNITRSGQLVLGCHFLFLGWPMFDHIATFNVYCRLFRLKSYLSILQRPPLTLWRPLSQYHRTDFDQHQTTIDWSSLSIVFGYDS